MSEAFVWIAAKDERPTLVMLPGVGCDSHIFAETVPHLVRHFNLLMYNNPGTAGRPLPDEDLSVEGIAAEVAAEIERRNLQSVYVLGHSMGGFVAQRLAIMMPQRMQKVVLISTSYGSRQIDDDMRHIAFDVWTDFQKHRQLYRSNPERIYDFMLTEDFRQQQPEAYKAFALSMVHNSPPPETVLKHFVCGARFSAFGELSSVTCPVLVVHGLDDRMISWKSGHKLARAFANVRWLPMVGCGHLPFIEEPAVLNRIADFLLGDDSVGDPVAQDKEPNIIRRKRDALWRQEQLGLGGFKAFLKKMKELRERV